MFSKKVAALTLLAVAVAAQDSSSATSQEPSSVSATQSAPTALPSGVTPCILTCLTQAAATPNGCANFTDLTCVCTNTAFQNAAAECLSSQCTTEEQNAALELQQTECANVSASGSASATQSGSASGVTSARPTSTAPTSTNAATASASASQSNAAMSMGPMTGLLAVVAGFIGVAL